MPFNIIAYCFIRSQAGEVVKIALDVDDGRALVTGAGGEVTERTDKIGETTGSRTLGYHIAHEGGTVLLTDAFLDGILESLAGQLGEVVVGKILQLQLVGSSDEAGGIGRGNNGIGKLPDLSDGILECAVAVDHYFHMLSGQFKELCLNLFDHVLAVTGEELNLILGRLVGTEQTVFFVISAAVNGGSHNFIKTVNDFGTCCLQKALGPCTGVNVAMEDVLGIIENGTGVICEDDLDFCTGFTNEVAVICNVIHSGKGMPDIAEVFAVFLFGKYVAIGIDAAAI